MTTFLRLTSQKLNPEVNHERFSNLWLLTEITLYVATHALFEPAVILLGTIIADAP